MGTTTEIAKRLSFGDWSLHTPEVRDVPELLTAFRNPSAENFQRALVTVHTLNGERFEKMMQVAKRQAESGNESDLQRLMKQLSMVKNNFQTYDVQEEFMTALLQGKISDDGASGGTRDLGEQLKRQKAHNEELQTNIVESITALAEANHDIQNTYASVNRELEELENEVRAHSQWKNAQEAKGQSSEVASLAAEASSLEKICFEHEALASELESVIASELDEMEALHAEVTAIEDANANETRTYGADRFELAGKWCEELELLFGRLAGVEVIAIEDATLQLRLTTHARDAKGESHSYAHTLVVLFEHNSSKFCSIKLKPADVALSDIQAALHSQRMPLAMIVQQVHARIGAQKRRAFELEAARQTFSVLEVSEDNTLMRCHLANGAAELEFRLPLLWPAPGVSLELTDLQAVSGLDLKLILDEALVTDCNNLHLIDMLMQVETRVAQQLQTTSTVQ